MQRPLSSLSLLMFLATVCLHRALPWASWWVERERVLIKVAASLATRFSRRSPSSTAACWVLRCDACDAMFDEVELIPTIQYKEERRRGGEVSTPKAIGVCPVVHSACGG